MSPQRVEFKTFDGIILRGNLFEAKDPNAPIIVMTQGLSRVKENFVDNFAQFQGVGISALVYDHRGWGSSEGLPQFETNPLQQAEDYYDSITFAATLQPPGQRSRIAIWGIGHSGSASMIVGKDPQLSTVILVKPFTSGTADATVFPKGILEQAWADREAAAKAWAAGVKPR